MKKTIIILLTFLLLLAGCKDNKKDLKEQSRPIVITPENKIVLKELTLESGSKVPTIEAFLQEGTIEESSELTFENLDEKVDEKALNFKTIYKNVEGQEVEQSLAECVEDENTMCPVITEEKHLVSTGEYKVVVTINGKEYSTKLIVKDETAPVVKTEDVTITEGDEVTIMSFVSKCNDNSSTKCSYKLINSENKEVNLKDLKKGEHKLTVVATDETGNETKKEVKLVINEKKKQETTTNKKPSTNNNTSNKKPSNNTNTNKKPANNGGNTNTKPSVGGNTKPTTPTPAPTPEPPKNTCTISIDTHWGMKVKPTMDNMVWYKYWGTENPISRKDFEVWEKSHSDMDVLVAEIDRMPWLKTTDGQFNLYSGRTQGGMYEVFCRETRAVVGVYMWVGYYPSYWIDETSTSYRNGTEQGQAFIDGNGNPHWIYKNFTPTK